jgi:hypothetical protein
MTDAEAPPAVQDGPIIELINDIHYCSPECPFLKEISMASGICLKDGEPLDFYDWYLSRCQEITAND